MGKNTEQKHHGGIPTDKSNPNRKWVKMLNVLDRHRWNYVKKILPHKKQGNEAIEASEAEVNNAGDKSYVCDGDVCTIVISKPEEKTTKKSGSSKKSSCPELGSAKKGSQSEENTTKESSSAKKGRAARFRAKIAKEVLKKKLRHKGSSTGPPPNTSVAENDPTHDVQPVSESVSAHKEINQPMAIMDTNHVEPLATDNKCDIPNTANMDHRVNNGTHVGEKSKVDLDSSDEEQIFPDLKLKNIEHLGRSATFHQSKELMDAMDVLSMNKDFFLKVLEDSESSLAQHFMVQHVSGKRKHLDKSTTFPRPCPSEEKELCSSLGVKPNRNSNLSVPPHLTDNLPKGEVADKPFKDLRHKIRHVIKSSKEERRRVAMDSVLHKVPYGTKKDVVEHLNLETDGKDCRRRSTRKDKKLKVNRWPSLNESIERYRQLLETSFHSKPKHVSSNTLKLRSKGENVGLPKGQRTWGSLARISSSPDLSLRLQIHLGDYTLMSPSRSPSRNIPFPRTKSLIKTSMSFNELNSHLFLSSLGKSGTEEEVAATPLLRDGDGEHNNLTKSPAMGLEDSYSEEDSDDSEKSIALSEDSRMSQQQDLFSLAESIADQEKPEAESLNHPHSASHHVRVKSKDQGHFDYVKDILQLSGYSVNQALGAWPSTNQPVEPSLFAELESFSLQEPDCSESEEETRCNRLLLFDSINEVLLSTYEKSMTYWHAPLTTSSRIHPMPKGYRVLEEVWGHISWYLNSSANQLESSLDHVIMHDLDVDDGWMNLQFEAEGTVLELEDLIFDELLMEAMPS